MCKPQGSHVLAFYLASFLKAANTEGKAGPDVDYTRLQHLGLTQSRHHVAPWTSVQLGDILNANQFFKSLSGMCVCFIVCLFVARQEEQARLRDVSLRQVSSLHLWQALQRRLSTEQEGLLHLHVQR